MSSPPSTKRNEQRNQELQSRSSRSASTSSSSASPPPSSWPLRLLTGLPILIFLLTAQLTFDRVLAAIPPGRGNPYTMRTPLLLDSDATPQLQAPLRLWYCGWAPLDNLLALYAAVFTGGIGGFDGLGRAQMVGFLADLVGVQVVMGVESARRGGSAWTVTGVLPTLLISLMYQIKGIAFLGPIYFYLHYVQCPPSRYAAPGSRATALSKLKALLPTVIITYIIPGIAMFTVPGIENRQWINGMIWQPFPIYAAILQPLLALVFDATGKSSSSSSASGRAKQTQVEGVEEESDIPILRHTYLFAAGVSSLAYLYIHLTAPGTLIDVFLTNLSEPSGVVTFMAGSTKALRYDYLCCFGGAFTWVLLSYRELKAASLVDWSWARIVLGMGAMVVTVGPGAMLAVMWYFREMALVKGVRRGMASPSASKRK